MERSYWNEEKIKQQSANSHEIADYFFIMRKTNRAPAPEALEDRKRL